MNFVLFLDGYERWIVLQIFIVILRPSVSLSLTLIIEKWKEMFAIVNCDRLFFQVIFCESEIEKTKCKNRELLW